MIARRLVTALGVLSMASVGAIAADLPTNGLSYFPAPFPIYNWTGCYVGLNAGGAWGRMHDDWTPTGTAFTPDVASSLQANGTTTLDGSGFTGGGQVGCNYQVSQLVFGGEADIQYTGLDESRDLFVPASGLVSPLNIHNDFRSRWLATFRGRLGYLASPTVLFYGTGGLAVADLDVADSVVDASNLASFNAVSGSETRVGWTIGGGVEWKLAPRWSVKAEYLYVDLGHFDTTSINSLTPADSTIVHQHNLTENIARAGVNYHF